MKLLFTGDIMLNQHWANGESPLFQEDVANYINDHDHKFINLESPAKGQQGENLQKNPRVYTTEDAIRNLKGLKLSVINIGNNHVYDQLEDGVQRTINAIQKINALSVGAIDTKNQCSYYQQLNSQDRTIHILAYVDANTNPKLPDDSEIALRDLTFENLEADLKALKTKEQYLVVTSFHWGFDNHKMPAPYQRKLAKKAIDCGADIVWGHHAHVIQPIEYYRGKLIIYCQGNTCADSINQDRILNKYQKTSFLVSVDYNHNSEHPEFQFKKLNRTLPHNPAYFLDRDFKPSKLDVFQNFPDAIYAGVYKLYLIHFFLEKAWLFLFRPGKKPIAQINKMFKRLAL